MDSKLADLYQQISARGQAAIENNALEFDQYLGTNRADDRWGLTLLGHLPANINRNISFVLQQAKTLEPDQYYNPAVDRHVTIMDIVGAQAGQVFTRSQFSDYEHLLQSILVDCAPVHWHFSGLMVSPGALMVKGDYSPALTQLRLKLRQAIPAANLPLAERYPTISGHVTIARFTHRLSHPHAFLRLIQENQTLAFGSFAMSAMDLVVHDWYNRRIKMSQQISLMG
ncbi:2'-5' RNA ligase family protein [Limosilactobacillus panis]|uniref:2'-5' RNA ligase family protein n=1 Tax=Limosilactobacillus panis TaxID=47493 RepID=UPI001C96DC2A|nr:2'-5' RNA ligase family protein [Limosilactobacillus panis]QZN92455.1 2'-5' RNA ligase family protein [Limosilactobacillus panis]